ncbi:MAG: hypothetical protein Q4C47_07780, partial [Planctomycetia bacterium]|nr:hypothetical protein [Planctomycetia bacterium]
MTDYQEFRDLLTNSRQSGSLEGYDEFCRVTEEYAQACRHVNALLARCNRMLSQGLRSEAIRLAEQEHLLDAVSALDIWSPEVWLDVAQQYQIDPPPPLATGTAIDLNEAWIQEMPQKELLARHRLLALARAPLAARVQVMRRIAAIEPDGPIATTDLPTFEQELLRQLLEQMWDADRRGDAEEFLRVYDLCAAEPWCVEIPPQSLERMRQCHNRSRARVLNARLSQLGPELNSAHSELDVVRGRSLREQWTAAIAQGGGLENPTTVAEAAAAMEWLRQEDLREKQQVQFQRAVGQLQTALDQNVKDPDELGKWYQKILSFQLPIDPYLQRRYQQQMESLALGAQQQRRNRLFLIVAILTGIV